MTNYKEIVTKAVIGKSKKISTSKFTLTPELIPNTILGCWVINHHFKGINDNGIVLIEGTFDINVWYSYDNDTKTAVSTKTFSYQEKVPVHLKNYGTLTNKEEIIVRSLKQPSVTNVSINNDNVNLNVESELGVEIVGDTKIKVSIEEVDDDYELITDEEILSTSDEEEINKVDENYL